MRSMRCRQRRRCATRVQSRRNPLLMAPLLLALPLQLCQSSGWIC